MPGMRVKFDPVRGENVVVPDDSDPRVTYGVPTGTRAELLQRAWQALEACEEAAQRLDELAEARTLWIDHEEHQEELRVATLGELRQRYERVAGSWRSGVPDGQRFDEMDRIVAEFDRLGADGPVERIDGLHWMHSTLGCRFGEGDAVVALFEADLIVEALELLDAADG